MQNIKKINKLQKKGPVRRQVDTEGRLTDELLKAFEHHKLSNNNDYPICIMRHLSDK